MLRSLQAYQFLEWYVYAQLEPFGEERADWRTAQIVAALWNIARDTTKHKSPFPTSQFLLKFEEIVAKAPKKRKQTWRQQKDMAIMIAKAFNAKALKRQ